MKSCLALFSGERSRLSSAPRRRPALTLAWLGALVCTLLACAAQAAPTCYRYGGAWENNIPNKLYLYFPTAADASFPNYPQSCGTPVSPAQPFNVSDLDSGIGTTGQLRNGVFDVVTDAYCEFNVQVRQSTANPDAFFIPDPRRNVVAVGSDSGGCFGVAQNYSNQIDLGDTHPADHARVWGGSYPTGCGAATEGALEGGNSTLTRWANAIGSTSAHEAGHNYGLQHGDDSFIHTGEDNRFHHIMPSATLPGESAPVPDCTFRASPRHFSDTTFSILAHNIGLVSQTMGNWDFVNPNAGSATQLRMEVLSTAASLTLTYWWNGVWSPWSAPSVSGVIGTTTFQGTVYNRFHVTWNAGKAWEARNNPGTAQTPGLVPSGATFHIGAEFNGSHYYDPDPYIIREVVLLNGGTTLPLQPRMAGYDNGSLDMSSGDFIMRFFSFDSPLILKDLTIHELPRKITLDSMQFGMEMKTWDGQPVIPWRTTKLGDFSVTKDGIRIPVRNLFQEGHNVFIVHGRDNPKDASQGGAEENPDTPGSISVDLFPSTTVYVTATVIDPSVHYKDPKTGEDKVAESLLFYQFAGKRERRPLTGQVKGLIRLKVACTDLTTRQSLAADMSENLWDCTSAGLSASVGDSINVIVKGVFNGEQNAAGELPLQGTVEGMKVQKVVCTNLTTRASANANLDEAGNWNCQVDKFSVKAGDSINVIAKGVIN